MPRPVEWAGNRLRILDQTELPLRETYFETDDYVKVAEAIRSLRVRGAPLIGVTAAYGLALAVFSSRATSPGALMNELEDAKVILASTRPTAVNLFTSLDTVMRAAAAKRSVTGIREAVLEAAAAIYEETDRADRELSGLGAKLISDGDTVLTICNTGALATGAYGTALGVIRTASEEGKDVRVLACETRPLLQGARLTMWELTRLGLPAKLIVDSAAGYLMKKGEVDKVITGADRIAANGDTANKIGTYMLACLAARHDLPFYIAAPVSTIDYDTAAGEYIAVEERLPDEVTSFNGVRTAPVDADARNPAFDITPAELITAIITDRGIARPPYKESLDGLAAQRADR